MGLNDLVCLVLALVRKGVVWDHGATCPICGRRMRTESSGSKKRTPRVRYHKCTNPDCILGSMALLVKSVERRKKVDSARAALTAIPDSL